jgi:alpha-amylase
MLTLDDVIYFVLTDRFCNGDPSNDQPADINNPQAFHGGDFAGLRKKIPYFKKLGVTAIWLTPVYLNIDDFFSSAGYHGYWAIDFERIDPHLYHPLPGRAAGSKVYLQELVSDFHAAGLKVILDMVVNHTGYHTPEYQQYPAKKLRFPEDFNSHQGDDEVTAWLAGLPDLDHRQPAVADYFVQNILDWIDQTGIDAIRMDTVKHVDDTFWYLFKAQIKTSRPQLTLLGEVLDYDPGYVGRYQQQHDFDTLFDFPLCGQLKGCLVWDRPMTELARPRLQAGEPQGILDRDRPYSNANRLVTLLDNHDLDRRITSEILDRVGHWDRDLARKILQLCLSVLFTTRGIPQLYYGTELGLEGGKDPDNRRDLPWEQIGANHRPKADQPFARQIYDHLQRLIRIRKANPALRYGTLYTLYVDQFVYACLREYRGNLVLVAVNNGHAAMPFLLPLPITANANLPPRIKQLLSDGTILQSQFTGTADLQIAAGAGQVQLAGKTAGIYCLANGDSD